MSQIKVFGDIVIHFMLSGGFCVYLLEMHVMLLPSFVM